MGTQLTHTKYWRGNTFGSVYADIMAWVLIGNYRIIRIVIHLEPNGDYKGFCRYSRGFQ